ncbi:MAG: molybdenum cofactor guanylyltransferase [Bacteroidales bacterium]|jgi:molybdopterin-guanine dinucleotide biosynthesis protein A|nr:molybdenum cofactor guanylyltransferase [Bacteroidales bacterium]MCU0408009.1 molybdenum cofactor guanylyltransferase [Bacteroidales bacterium]
MAGDLTAAVLAGGESRRFGGIAKPRIIIRGKMLIGRILEATAGIFSEIIIVTNSPEDYADIKGCRLVPDLISGAGPLGGIHSALVSSSARDVFVFAGDMPFIDREIVLGQADLYFRSEYEVLIPRVGNNIEPLHAIYSKALAGPLEEYLSAKQRPAVRDFIRKCRTGYLELEDNEKTRSAFTNINTPGDISLPGNEGETSASGGIVT